MHKKETHDLELPGDDIDCWEKYPKQRWVYDLSRLLDAQHIRWSPYKTDDLTYEVQNMEFESDKPVVYDPARIFIKEPTEYCVWTEVFITKGEIKLMRKVDIKTKKEVDGIIGSIELRINAFVTLYFQKFTGVISVGSVGADIYSIRLRPVSELALEANVDVVKLSKRIYKRTGITLHGLTDQELHESLAS